MDLFDLVAKITLDSSEYESKLPKLGDTIKKGLATAAKVGAAAIGVASSAVGALVKNSVESYAEYEQLVGGAQIMFGEAYDFVAEKAANAYSTVQMSQSDYLKQVNSFATGLKTSLGGDAQAAAELADRILTAEADVIAATGNSREAVENAFNGIMKSNFTMLDNLQLGITPTKEGFQEVIDKVNEWNATVADRTATDYQIGNLADMQNALVDYIEMVGMAGYAHDEAAGTIQGSLASAKAAWSNLITGIADDNADFGKLVDNVVSSATTAAKNILPRISKSLAGIGKLVEGMAPVITQALPVLINQVIPGLLEAAGTLVSTFANSIIENLPMVFDVGLSLIMMLVGGLIENIPHIIDTITDVVLAITEKLTDGETIGKLAVAALQIMIALANGIISSLPRLISQIPTIIRGFIDGLKAKWPDIKAAGVELLGTLLLGIDSVLDSVLDAAGRILNMIDQGIKAGWDSLKNVGRRIIEGILQGLKDAWGAVVSWFSGVVGNLRGTAHVSVEKSEGGAGHAIGMDYVPYNGYAATLHRGEAVLTRSEAAAWRDGQGSGGRVVNLNITTTDLDQSKIDYIIRQANLTLGGALA